MRVSYIQINNDLSICKPHSLPVAHAVRYVATGLMVSGFGTVVPGPGGVLRWWVSMSANRMQILSLSQPQSSKALVPKVSLHSKIKNDICIFKPRFRSRSALRDWGQRVWCFILRAKKCMKLWRKGETSTTGVSPPPRQNEKLRTVENVLRSGHGGRGRGVLQSVAGTRQQHGQRVAFQRGPRRSLCLDMDQATGMGPWSWIYVSVHNAQFCLYFFSKIFAIE